MVRVSDVITVDEIKSWSKDEIVTINAGTGVGKSYFVKNILYNFAKEKNKKILMLVNRKLLKEQFKEEIENDSKSDVIDIATYQSIQSNILYGDVFDFSEYEYIVCDEFHYFFTDANFNNTTDLSLNLILNQSSKVRILMSATCGLIMSYLENYKDIKLKKYEVPKSYNCIQELNFFNSDKTSIKLLSELISSKEKAIYFCGSAKKAYSIHKKFKNSSLFNCSSYNITYSKHVDKDKIKQMIVDEKFDEQILITTASMDNGVNIKDRAVKHIIADIEDFDVLIQCLGRKRTIDEDDKVNIYIKNISNNQIGGKLTQLNKSVKMADFLWNNDVKSFLNKYPRQNYGSMIYDMFEDDNMIKKVNEIMYFKCNNDIIIQNLLLTSKDKRGYRNYVKNLLQQHYYVDLEEKEDAMTLEEKLDKLIGIKMFKEEQKEFKNFLNDKLINAVKGSHGKIGLNTINGFFEDNKYKYIIRSDRETSGVNKGKRYWIIGKINY